ncbi:hypothetical protein RJ641_027523 [Dillenia turbinata]|uniref:Uncharacterized protein n=1 Tax=Dillenia turbinata TaxID=194707 RepID=A0AAN8W6A0_9MAGN
MDFSEQWKSLFPIASVFTPPLLLSSKPHLESESELGPLFFTPSPKTLTLLLSSPSLSPPSHSFSSFPFLSLSRFLQTSSLPSVPPSVSSSIASSSSSSSDLQHSHPSSFFTNNRLQFLRCPHNDVVLAFFPTGDNSDRVGYLLLSVRDSNLTVELDSDGDVFTADTRFNHGILKIVLNSSPDNANGCFGYLMACTMYTVHWFTVKFNETIDDSGGFSSRKNPVLDYVGGKEFKSCGVVDACWSPHVPEDSVVLLETGELFLFDLAKCLKSRRVKENLLGTRLPVRWDNLIRNSGKVGWLRCEFSWHPRILIVVHSSAIYLVDLRFEVCNVSCLAKIGMRSLNESGEADQFVAFSKAGNDGFSFVVATEHVLLLCDVRKPLIPLLQWIHDLDSPRHVDVFRLSDLRSHSIDDKYKHVSEVGFGIILGSFWNCEFGLFCYGPYLPKPRTSVASKIQELCYTCYAWELPSELQLSGRGCCCGSCLVREEFFKEALPEWVNWQQKKELVLGFGVLSSDLFAEMSEPEGFGGFVLIRLMSSGKLEYQKYIASWGCVRKVESCGEKSISPTTSSLDCIIEEEYKFTRKFKYFTFKYLYGFLSGNLSQLLVSKVEESNSDLQEKNSFNLEFHKFFCEKLKAFGLIQSELPPVSEVFKDVSTPTSIYEVALRRVWAGLPINLLLLAFSNYSEFLDVTLDSKLASLDFLAVPDQPQLPPFFLRNPSSRSNKWTNKVQRSDTFVGPVLPLPILTTISQFRGCGPSVLETEEGLGCHFDEVMNAANEITVSDSVLDLHSNHDVSLANDFEEPWAGTERERLFLLHNPGAFSYKRDSAEESSIYLDEKIATLVSKVTAKEPLANGKTDVVGLELFDDLSPVELKYDAFDINFGPGELKAHRLLKTHFSRWQERDLYELDKAQVVTCSPKRVKHRSTVVRSFVIPMLEAATDPVPVEKLAVHFHDTYGQVLSNILASLEDAPGNIATEDEVYMLNGLGVNTGVDLGKFMLTAQFSNLFSSSSPNPSPLSSHLNSIRHNMLGISLRILNTNRDPLENLQQPETLKQEWASIKVEFECTEKDRQENTSKRQEFSIKAATLRVKLAELEEQMIVLSGMLSLDHEAESSSTSNSNLLMKKSGILRARGTSFSKSLVTTTSTDDPAAEVSATTFCLVVVSPLFG